MFGTINIYTSRRTYKRECKWFNQKKENSEKLEYEEFPSGVFYAKEVSPNTFNKTIIAGVLQFNSSELTLETIDDVSSLVPNCKVLYDNDYWIVNNVQRNMIKKQSEFSKKPSVITYISLRK